VKQVPPPSRLKIACALVALTAVALGAVAVGVIAGAPDSGPGIEPTAEAPSLRAHAVPGGPPKRGQSPPRIVYLETTYPVNDIKPGRGGYIIERCPKSSVAVNGYYFQRVDDGSGGTVGVFEGFGLDDQGSSPAGYRKWAFYYDNVTTQEIDGVTFGLICDKDG
jgi:hypothetical protein